MRYIKVLLLVLLFFFSMLFLFQNQEVLGKDMTLKLNLFFLPPFQSTPLPTYFILLAGFLIGALCTVALLLWDKLTISAALMKARWKIREMEKEIAKYGSKQSSAAEGNNESKLPLKKAVSAKNDISAPDPDRHI